MSLTPHQDPGACFEVVKLAQIRVDRGTSAGNAENFLIKTKFFLVFIKKTYKSPLKNRKTVNNQNDFTKLETIVMKKEMKSVGIITRRRPRVSARKPQRCDEAMMPTKAIALSIPLSFVVRFKSHSAIGRMNEMPSVSSKTVDKTAPLRITRK